MLVSSVRIHELALDDGKNKKQPHEKGTGGIRTLDLLFTRQAL